MPAFRSSDECSQQVKNVANVLSVLRKALSTQTPLHHSANLPSLYNIQLPQAPPIATLLNTHCIKPSLAKDLSRAYERHVSDLRKCTETQIQRLLQHCQENEMPFDLLEKQVASYISLYETRVKHWYTLLSNEIKPGKSEFNTERIPLLITYFKHNAYPSTNDRIWLARETGNTPQQISIWFQNRRRRSRKAGVELKRVGPDEVPHNLFTEDPGTCPPHSSPTHPAKRPRVSSQEVTTDEEVPLACSSLSGTATLRPHERLRVYHDPTDSKIPPYTTYKCSATSSCWSRFTKPTFLESNWERKSASRRDTRQVRSSAVSVDDLCSMMAAKLRLFCSHPSPSPVTGTPWHAARYTHPSPSPLPALVRSKQPYHSTIGSTSPTIRSSHKRKRSEINEERPPPRSKRFRSLSTSSYSSFSGGDSCSSDNSSCNSSSPGPQTPPSTLWSLPLSPRFVDWSKFSIPTVPQAYGLYQ